MGCTIDMCRCAFGCFHVKCHLYYFKGQIPFVQIDVSFWNLLRMIVCIFVIIHVFTFLQSCNPNVNIIFTLMLFLLVCGDIHPNPGPISSTGNSSVSDSCPNCLGILHLNIRSMRNKLNFIESFANDVDILCLTETHLDPSITDDQLAIDNFNQIFRKDRNMY